MSANDRVRLLPAATRRAGSVLLVAAPRPFRPVEELSGTGPETWLLLSAGLSIREAAKALAAATGAPMVEVEVAVLEFAGRLIDSGLAERE